MPLLDGAAREGNPSSASSAATAAATCTEPGRARVTRVGARRVHRSANLLELLPLLRVR